MDEAPQEMHRYGMSLTYIKNAVDSHELRWNVNLPCPDPLRYTNDYEDVPYFFVGK